MHMDICEELGVGWPVQVPRHLLDNKWLSTVQAREREIVCIAQLIDPETKWADTSQMMARARFNTQEFAPTVTPGSHLFSFGANRYLTGRDAMRLQGFPCEALTGVSACSDNQLCDLAGNSFSTSVICAIDVSLLLSAECLSDDGTGIAIKQAKALNEPLDEEFSLDLC